MDLEIGKIVEGKVIRITPFGAFVELAKGVSGLVHISEIANAYVNNIEDYVRVGDLVQVKIVSIEAEGKKIGLSIKQATEQPKPAMRPIIIEAEKVINDNFEDRLARFMKDSNEKQLALKKHQETKKCR